MEVFFYRTIERPAEGLYKEKGSKFLAFAYPVSSETDIREKIGHLKKQYFDARHHCFAWTLGPEKKQFRASDDGEPNHSAGDPILGQIRSKDLTNILVVVVRYFGGVKLGVGGLISAYRAAAEDALNNALIIEREVHESFWLHYDYATTPEVMRVVKEFELSVLEQHFGESCEMKVDVALKVREKFTGKIELLKAMGTNIVLVGTRN
jgi:uncharacterized YigZ family protein